MILHNFRRIFRSYHASVKNELGGSATQQELRVWGVGGHNGKNRGTGGLNPPNPPSIRTLIMRLYAILKCF